MPKVIQTNDSVKETVIRQVVLDVAKQVQEWTGLNYVPILFNGDTQVAVQPGSTIDEVESFNNAPGRALWRIQAKDEHVTDKLLATAVMQMEHPEYFYDEALRVFIRPVYSQTSLQLDFEYKATDISAARRWRDEIRTKVSMNRDIRFHDVEYYYFVPQNYFTLLEHIHTLRENQAGYGDTYDEWLKKSFTQNVTIASDMVGNNQRWAVREQQNRINGRFEFSELPDDPSKVDGSAYTLSFSYIVQFDCPIAAAMDYPLLVHNQLIEERFWGISPKDPFRTYASRSSISRTALDAFEVPYSKKQNIETGLRFPEFSEFNPDHKLPRTHQVLSALIGVLPPDPANPGGNRLAMNFKNFDDVYELQKEFLDYMAWDYKYLNKYGESFINVSLYNGGKMVDPSQYEVDKDLNVNFLIDPDLRSTYYVRLSIVADPSILTPDAKERLEEQGEGTILIGTILCPALAKNKLLPEVFGDNWLSKADVTRFLYRIQICQNTSTSGFQNNPDGGINARVMVLFLQAHRA